MFLGKPWTLQADVWSFGVVLWELLRFGALPYEGKRLEQVVEIVKSGERLSQPENCPDSLYQLMLSTWQDRSIEI